MPSFEHYSPLDEAPPTTRRKPRVDSRRKDDRAEYISPREILPADQPHISPPAEKVQIRERPAPVETAFDQETKNILRYAETVLNPLREGVHTRSIRPEVIPAHRARLRTLLHFLREELQPQGLELLKYSPNSPRLKENLQEIYIQISNVGHMMHQLDTLERQQEIRTTLDKDPYQATYIQPKEIPNTELGRMAYKWNQAPPPPAKPNTWSKMKSAWNSFWK